MKKYLVQIIEKLEHRAIIEADSRKDAEEQLEEIVNHQEFDYSNGRWMSQDDVIITEVGDDFKIWR